MSTYQVTGPVVEVRPDMLAVTKGKERWEIGQDRFTQVSGDLKVGSKRNGSAPSIEVKPAKGK